LFFTLQAKKPEGNQHLRIVVWWVSGWLLGLRPLPNKDTSHYLPLAFHVLVGTGHEIVEEAENMPLEGYPTVNMRWTKASQPGKTVNTNSYFKEKNPRNSGLL